MAGFVARVTSTKLFERLKGCTPLLHRAAFPRISCCCLYRCSGEYLPGNHPFRRAVVVWKSLSDGDSLSHRAALIARWTFGLADSLSALDLSLPSETVVPMIARSIPVGPTFRAVFAGIAFVLAGLAVVSGVLDALAAKLLGLMLLVPLVFASPSDHGSWVPTHTTLWPWELRGLSPSRWTTGKSSSKARSQRSHP